MPGHLPAAHPPPRQPSDFRLGEWFIQPMLNRASRQDITIHLRPQLMDLLVCLARHAGRTVGRDVLLEEVWRNQCVVDTAIARCIAELRQAFGDNAQAPVLIETIPKRGYRIIAPIEFSQAPVTEHPAVPVEATADTPSGSQTASETASRLLTILASALADSFSIWTRRG